MKTNSKGERPNIKISNKDVQFIPSDIHHLIRYLLSCKYLNEDSSVLDIGCGYGHGTLIQSLYAKKVTGLDISKESLEVANKIKEAKNLQNVSFVSNTKNLNEKFDVITAFEIIEHITKEEGVHLIKETTKLLKKDGFYIISTPFIDLRGKTYWYHHKHEYYLSELKKIMSSYFKNVSTYYSLADGFYLQKGFFKGLFSNPLSSASSIVLVCSNSKFEDFDYNQGKNPFYLLARGIYRNIKYFFKKHD